MMKLLKPSAILLLILINGCVSKQETIISEQFPLKIAMMADSQITTAKGVFDYGMRTKVADAFVDVAIRPAAVEYLAPDMMDIFYTKYRKKMWIWCYI